MKVVEQRKWEKPKLLVLARSRPEEAVLFVCKPSSDPVNKANTKNAGCYQIPDRCLACGS